MLFMEIIADYTTTTNNNNNNKPININCVGKMVTVNVKACDIFSYNWALKD
jgi:hypothetical protein